MNEAVKRESALNELRRCGIVVDTRDVNRVVLIDGKRTERFDSLDEAIERGIEIVNERGGRMASKQAYPATAEANSKWSETTESKRSIMVKTWASVDPGQLLDMVRTGQDLPQEFVDNRRIQEVRVSEEIVTVLTRKMDE